MSNVVHYPNVSSIDGEKRMHTYNILESILESGRNVLYLHGVLMPAGSACRSFYAKCKVAMNESQLLIPWIEVYAYLPPARESILFQRLNEQLAEFSL